MTDSTFQFRERYFKRKRIEWRCEVITPMFLGNADGEAEWRAEAFKAVFRWWWRVMQPKFSETDQGPAELVSKEGAIFGTAGEKDEAQRGKSKVILSLVASAKKKKDKFPELPRIEHPEVKGGKVDPLLYLAGVGLIQHGEVKHSYFPQNCRFRLTLDYPDSQSDSVTSVLAAIQTFGTVGARSRNGWGSFQIVEGGLNKKTLLNKLNQATRHWKEGFAKEYPNCLGKDDRPLLWKSKTRQSWSDVMRDLAEAYAGVRAREINGFPKLDPQKGHRHLLGIPLTNHPSPSGNTRYASPLRFAVRKHDNQYFGIALHVPQRFPNGMGKLLTDQEIKIWEIVHKKLDILLKRTSYEECL